MSGHDSDRPDALASSLPTLGTIAAWTPEQAELALDVLDALRAELWARHGEALQRMYHEDASRDAQCRLDLDEPPF